VIYYDYYAEVPPAVLDAFVRQIELGRLVTVGAEGLPHIGLYPFLYEDEAIELHLHRADEQLADLERETRCVFEVDDVLGVIPSYWVHPESAVMATAYHRTVVFECEASISKDGAALAEQQMRLMARYQPEGRFRSISSGDALYRGAVGVIAAIRLRIARRRVKFKLAQNRPPEVRRRIVAELRKRGRPNDGRAADAVEWTLEPGRAG
jgi:predicted FMN-binding regulatory protein PaiB